MSSGRKLSLDDQAITEVRDYANYRMSLISVSVSKISLNTLKL